MSSNALPSSATALHPKTTGLLVTSLLSEKTRSLEVITQLGANPSQSGLPSFLGGFKKWEEVGEGNGPTDGQGKGSSPRDRQQGGGNWGHPISSGAGGPVWQALCHFSVAYRISSWAGGDVNDCVVVTGKCFYPWSLSY